MLDITRTFIAYYFCRRSGDFMKQLKRSSDPSF